MSSNAIDYVGIGFCSNDYLSVLPHIPYDSKVQMVEHLVQGGGPAATATVAAARLGLSAAFISTLSGYAVTYVIMTVIEYKRLKADIKVINELSMESESPRETNGV